MARLLRRPRPRRPDPLFSDLVDRTRERLRDDSGLSLIELVIASAISLVVVAALLATLGSASRAEVETQVQQSALGELRAAMTRASTDIRQATALNAASTGSRLDTQTLVDGTAKRVIYAVDGTSLRRTVCADAGFAFASPCGGTPAELVRDVSAAAVFCYDPPSCTATATPSVTVGMIRITLASVSPAGSDASNTLATEVQLRNI